jgi:hypothetical protein
MKDKVLEYINGKMMVKIKLENGIIITDMVAIRLSPKMVRFGGGGHTRMAK